MESVALAIMVSNDIVVPLVLKRREKLGGEPSDAGGWLLTTRRIAIFVILFLAYVYYRSAGDAQLAAIGLLSFAAVAQLAPAFFGGLIWQRGTARGAIAGMTVGILIWGYTLLLPMPVRQAQLCWPMGRGVSLRYGRKRCLALICRRWFTAWYSASLSISSSISPSHLAGGRRRSSAFRPTYSCHQRWAPFSLRKHRVSGCAGHLLRLVN
jgi:Na+/proline symporter